MSFKPEVIADSSGKWVGTELRFATEQEAQGYVRDLEFRWAMVRDTRVIQNTDPVNYIWNNGKAVSIPKQEN